MGQIQKQHFHALVAEQYISLRWPKVRSHWASRLTIRMAGVRFAVTSPITGVSIQYLRRPFPQVTLPHKQTHGTDLNDVKVTSMFYYFCYNILNINYSVNVPTTNSLQMDFCFDTLSTVLQPTQRHRQWKPCLPQKTGGSLSKPQISRSSSSRSWLWSLQAGFWNFCRLWGLKIRASLRPSCPYTIGTGLSPLAIFPHSEAETIKRTKTFDNSFIS